MSLIKQHSDNTVLDQLQVINTNCLVLMKQTAITVFNMFWHNKQHTPQEMCDLLGADAKKAFEAHSGLQQLIYLLDPTWAPLIPPLPYTANDDGTVVIGSP